MDLQERSEELLRSRFGDEVIGAGAHMGQRWVEIKRERVVEILRTLRDELGFDMLMDLTATDWLDQGRPERFAVVYELFSLQGSAYFRVKAWVPEGDPTIDSVHAVWKSAPFAEREVFDMFGIRFAGHPDLKRLLLPDHYPGFPLRKDYPLTGHGERYDFPKHLGQKEG